MADGPQHAQRAEALIASVQRITDEASAGNLTAAEARWVTAQALAAAQVHASLAAAAAAVSDEHGRITSAQWRAVFTRE